MRRIRYPNWGARAAMTRSRGQMNRAPAAPRGGPAWTRARMAAIWSRVAWAGLYHLRACCPWGPSTRYTSPWVPSPSFFLTVRVIPVISAFTFWLISRGTGLTSVGHGSLSAPFRQGSFSGCSGRGSFTCIPGGLVSVAARLLFSSRCTRHGIQEGNGEGHVIPAPVPGVAVQPSRDRRPDLLHPEARHPIGEGP